jgi:transposase-like protein
MHRESLILFALLLLLLLSLFWIRSSRHSREVTTPANPKIPRPLRPRFPDDCPFYCAQTPSAAATDPPSPWNHVKSRRGRRKRIDTEGYACTNPKCRYCGITDAGIHALVGYGSHGKNERIQDIRCQACGCKFTTRRDTPLYRLKTSPRRIGEVLSALAEGLDVAAAVRVFGRAEATIQRWLTRSGMHARSLHRHLFRSLHLWHIQLDELKRVCFIHDVLHASVNVDYNLRRQGKRFLADLFFIRQWKDLMSPRAHIERHFAWMKRYFGLKNFRVQGYLAVTQFVFRVYIAALIVAFAATRCQRPELATSRSKVLAFVNT